MFNQVGTSHRFNNWKILGGISMSDYNSHKTMFAGPDPADPSRVLIRKLVQTSDKVWCFEESRVSPGEAGGLPTVHTTLHRLGWINIDEPLTPREASLRLQYWPVPNVVGFSLFMRPYESSKKKASFTIVENSAVKTSGSRWAEWLRDVQDTRDISAYLRLRWLMN